MKDLFMKFTKEQLRDYRKRLQNYRISREFFESLYREEIIEEIDFYELNIKLLKKYRIPFNSVFNTKLKK